MHIGIFGNHPTVKPGFDSAMSMNQCAAFSQRGHRITLYIGIPKNEPIDSAISSLGIKCLDDLPRYDMEFDIIVISDTQGYAADLDVLIWQTYRQDLEYLYPVKREFITTKNFPRFAAKADDHSRIKLVESLKKYDKIAMALKVDEFLAHSMLPERSESVSHVPRGFSDTWLPSDLTAKRVTFACDAAVKPDDGGLKSTEYMVRLFKELKSRGHEFDILATRGSAQLVGANVRIPALPLMEFYKEYICPSWIYLPCNFNYSVHSKNSLLDENGDVVFVGLYENQIVEMQMAGAVPVCKTGSIDTTLLANPQISTFSKYEDIDKIASMCEEIIQNFYHYSEISRRFSTENHSLDLMYKKWLDLIQS